MGHQIKSKPVAVALMLVFVFINGVMNYPRATKRSHFNLRDYVVNVFRSVPANAILVFHKDVQLFSLWEAQLIQGKRPDVALVASGLSASPWYWDMRRRWPTSQVPPQEVKTPEGMKALADMTSGRPLLFGHETELVTPQGYKTLTWGLALRLWKENPPKVTPSFSLLRDLALHRNSCVYGETPDFFITDLVGDEARAFQRSGFDQMMAGMLPEAIWCFKKAEAMDPTFARASSDLGYLYFTQNDFRNAQAAQARAIRKNKAALQLTKEYRSLTDVVGAYTSDLSNSYLYYGAATEKLGDVEKARSAYQASHDILPNAQAQYNLAVTYWNKDWEQVLTHLRQALAINPNMESAGHYYAVALQKMGRKS